jgi:hypothetical protein
MYTEITKCRICKSPNLIEVLNLGVQELTGVFPKPGEKVEKGPLKLVWCEDCGLLQMKESYSLDEMYGDNYGYRSGLNQSMVDHLTRKIQYLEKFVKLKETDLVMDIGSNDGTSLKAYQTKCRKIGIDPTAKKFAKFYQGTNIDVIPRFFSADVAIEWAAADCKIITSIAMFYDLPNPTKFVQDIFTILAEDGVWHLEQSYMPSMLAANAYDAICHEHLEFYSLTVIKNLLEANGFMLIDVELNDINGGSIAITACKDNPENNKRYLFDAKQHHIENLIWNEKHAGFNTVRPYEEFENRVYLHRVELSKVVRSLTGSGKKVFGYGASTKGNVMLQFCQFTPDEIPYIADVNPDKFGCVTPGTHIPIISEEDARAIKPDYFLVFPWHFRKSILKRETEFIKNGGKFIFPLPEVEIV